jgi:hypothetical protein
MEKYTADEKKEIRNSLLKNSIFFCLGWIVMMFGVVLASIPNIGNIWLFHKSVIVLAIGWLILGFPKLLIFLRAGFGAVFSSPNATYEVVTKNSYGNVVGSDGGMQSSMQSIVLKLVLLAIIYVLGGFIQIIHLLILSFKCGIRLIGIPIILVNIAVAVGGLPLTAPIAERWKGEVTNQSVAVEQGTTARVIKDNAGVHANLRLSTVSNPNLPIKFLSTGDVVNVLGISTLYPAWAEISHEETKGWILFEDIDYKAPPDADVMTIRDVQLLYAPSVEARTIKTIKKGQMVTIMHDMEFKDPFVPVKHGKHTGWVNSRGLNLDN